MPPQSPQREVSIVVGKKNKRRKTILWVCLSALGGLLAWSTLHPEPFNIMNGLKRTHQTHQPKPTRIDAIGASKTPHGARLGVSVTTVQSLFEQPNIGFTFERAAPIQGDPRLIGTSTHGLAVIELIGQPENLTRAIIRVSIPDNDIHALALNAEYVLRFIQTVAPQWKAGGNWVIQNLDAFASGQRPEVRTIEAGKAISMTLTGEQEFLTITVKSAQ